jgi:Rrf2 family protein
MKVTSRSRYGFRTILELALKYGKGPIQINAIAQKENISDKYLEQLIAMLRMAGFVKSIRGPKGGYVLEQKPSEIKLSSILSALEGPMPNVDCTKHSKFTKGCTDCVTKRTWAKIHGTMWDQCESMTLQDLVDITEGKREA